MLEDQAATARAAIALYEATGNMARLDQARAIVEAAFGAFGDADGSFLMTATDATDVPLTRLRVATESATPSGTGMMAEVFARLWHLTGEPVWRDRASALISAFSGAGEQASGEQFGAMPTLLAASGLLEAGGSIVIVGGTDPGLAARLAAVARAASDPSICVVELEPGGAVGRRHPASDKTAGTAGAAAYICRGGVCGLPVNAEADLADLLRRSGGGAR
jgi:uncharacterized protein YyaL (SSP411 family)